MRLALALGCLLLLAWLIYGAVFTRSRAETLTAALADGRIGGLTPEASEHLLSQLRWLAGAAGVTEEVTLNQPLSPGRLSFYTTTPAAYNVTHCARRNAVYDAELDAVFIDLGLIDDGEFRSILEASGYGSVTSLNDLPFFRAYLRFIVLHELGHRQLHRRGRGIFDMTRATKSGAARTREVEADQFAIRAMQDAYMVDKEASGNFTAGSAGDFLGLSEDELAVPGNRVWVDLISMASAMNMFDLFLQNPYAPFYEDRAHPTFLHRAKGLIDQALRQPDLNEKLRARFAFFDEFLGREAGVLNRPLTEVILADPIEGVSFDERGLVIASRGLKALLRVPYAELAPPRAGDKSVSVTRGAVGAGFDEDKSAVWGGPSPAPLAFGEGGKTYAGGASAWEESETEIAKDLAGQTSPHIYLPPQPSRTALAISSTTGDMWQERWYVLRDYHVAQMRTASEIADLIAAHGGASGCSLIVNTVTEQRVYVTAKNCSGEERPNTLGVAVLDAATLDVLKFVSLELPDGLPEDNDPRLVVVQEGDTDKFIMVSDTRGARPSGWVAWQLSAESAPRRLASQQYLAAEVSHGADGSLLSSFNPGVSFAAWLPGGYVIIGCNADSVYLLDLKDNTTRILFHPGDELLKICVHRDGLVALYMRGGYKCYVIRPSDWRARSHSLGARAPSSS